jgi:hypothetical protein
LPRPEPWEVEGRRGTRPGPPLCLSSSCTTPTAVTALEPTHSTPRPRPNPSSTRARPPCPVLLDVHRQGPRTGELLDALAPDALAYKSPCRSNEWTRPAPSYLPDTFSPSRSRSKSPAMPASYWAQAAPPCWAAAGRTDAGAGGGVLPDSFLPAAVEPCFLSITPSPSNSRPCKRRWALPSQRGRCLWAVGSWSVGSVPVRCG